MASRCTASIQVIQLTVADRPKKIASENLGNKAGNMVLVAENTNTSDTSIVSAQNHPIGSKYEVVNVYPVIGLICPVFPVSAHTQMAMRLMLFW
jgi:hypothetical protein